MSYYYSARSRENLEECHVDIQTIFNEVIKYYDCTITEGSRDEKTQNEYFRIGKSKLEFPESKHNVTELRPKSMAIDAVPCPIDWLDKNRFYHFSGFVIGISKILFFQGKISHQLRHGGDWDSDNNFKDQSFHDLPHFELIE